MKWKKYIGQCGNFDFVMQSIDIIFCLKLYSKFSMPSSDYSLFYRFLEIRFAYIAKERKKTRKKREKHFHLYAKARRESRGSCYRCYPRSPPRQTRYHRDEV